MILAPYRIPLWYVLYKKKTGILNSRGYSATKTANCPTALTASLKLLFPTIPFPLCCGWTEIHATTPDSQTRNITNSKCI